MGSRATVTNEESKLVGQTLTLQQKKIDDVDNSHFANGGWVIDNVCFAGTAAVAITIKCRIEYISYRSISYQHNII